MSAPWRYITIILFTGLFLLKGSDTYVSLVAYHNKQVSIPEEENPEKESNFFAQKEAENPDFLFHYITSIPQVILPSGLSSYPAACCLTTQYYAVPTPPPWCVSA